MNTQNTATARMLYENALKIITDAGLDPRVVKLTQSDLVLEQQITTQTNYTFAILTNDNGPAGTLFNTELRLVMQDSLIAGAWGFFLLEPLTAIDATIVAHTYPNPVAFAAAGEALALETLYNSYVKITVNKDVVGFNWHMSRHRLVPFAQRTTGVATIANAIANDQIDLSSDGFFPVEPNIVFIGSKGSIIELKLPAPVAVIGAAGFTRMRMHYRGLLAQNSTIIT
jgi:hypothetical protein